MQFSRFFALLSIISYAVALPIPAPGVITVVHTAPTSTVVVKSTTTVTTTIPVVRVLISGGATYTSTLTTIYTAVSGEDVNKAAIPSTLYSTINFDTTGFTILATPAQNNFIPTSATSIVEAATSVTFSTEAPAAASSDVTTFSAEAPATTTSGVTTSSIETPAAVSSAETTAATSTAESPAAASSAETTAATSTAESPAAASSAETTAATSTAESPAITFSTEAQAATTSDVNTFSADAPATTTSDVSTSSAEAPASTTSISIEATSTSTLSETDLSSQSETLEITTLPKGESFVASLADKLVSATNVAPIFAVTTITASSGQTGSASASLSVTTLSNGQVLLGTLTEGLGHDTNVAANLANPGTVSVTNTAVTTTQVATTSSSVVSTSTSTSATAATSTGSSDYLSAAPSAIVYSPYQDDGSCKTYATVLSDITLIQSKGVGELRIYGNDCNYLTTVLPIANELGLKINQGFWISSDGVDSIDDAVSNFITYMESGAASYDWDLFSFITVGNEAIISNYCSVSDLISKISSVKSQLNAAGYTGLITTSEPPVSFENNPELCTQSEIDFVGINPHAYFDTYSSAETAGTFVKGQIALVSQYCGDKSIRVTETGYPSAGIQNGGNIPSAENQKIALQDILDVVGTEITLLTTYNDYWKQPGAYGIEQSFGMIQLLE